LQLREFLTDAELNVALDRGAIGDRTALFHLALDFFVSEIKNCHQGRWPKLLARDYDGFQSRRFAESTQEPRVGLLRSAEGKPFGEDDGPRINREDREQGENGYFQRVPLDHFPKIYLQKEGKGSFETQLVS